MFSTARLDLLPCTHGTLNEMGTSLHSLLAFSLHACSLWGSSVALASMDGREEETITKRGPISLGSRPAKGGVVPAP